MLRIQAPGPGILTSTAICEAVAGKDHLESLQIDFLVAKISIDEKEFALDFSEMAESLRENFFESYIEEVL